MAKKKLQELSNCPHCGGTGTFVSCPGTVDEIEKKCVCQVEED